MPDKKSEVPKWFSVGLYILIADMAYLFPHVTIAMILCWISYQIERFHAHFIEEEDDGE